MAEVRMFARVAMRLMAPRMELAPAKCREKIALSMQGLEQNSSLVKGG
jgi:hypothetical protein